MSAVAHETCRVLRSCLTKSAVWASLDRGSTLVKVVLVDRQEELHPSPDSDLVTVHCYLFGGDDVSAALHLIKGRVHIPTSNAVFNATGIGFCLLKRMIEETLGVAAVFIDEFAAQGIALCSLFRSAASADELFHPPPGNVVRHAMESGLVMSRTAKEFKAKMTANDRRSGNFPALLIIAGAATRTMLIDEKGKFKGLGCNSVGGLSFMGLARLLLGTKDFNEIASLADKGDISKTHLQMKDVILSANALYGSHPADLTYMPFGGIFKDKVAGKEDVAASLVSLFAAVIHNEAVHASLIAGVSRVYVCGEWTQPEVVRRHVCEQWTETYPNDVLQYRFVKSGFLNALGASMLQQGRERELLSEH